jgi:hypothetical protein
VHRAPSDITFRWAGKFQTTSLVGEAFGCEGSFEKDGRLVKLTVTLPEQDTVILYVPIVKSLYTAVRNIVALRRIVAFTCPASMSVVAVHLYGAYYGCTSSLDEAIEAWKVDRFRQTFSLRHH